LTPSGLHGFIAIQQDYGWDGLNCYEYATYDETVDAPVEVFRVQFIRVVTPTGNTNFTTSGGTDFIVAHSAQASSAICNGDTFSIIIRLKKSTYVTLYPNADSRNFVDTPEDSQYRVNGGGLQDGHTEAPYITVSLTRISPSNPNRSIRAQVAGYDLGGDFSSRGFVTFNCQ
jgi:hypothetical protein